MPITDRQLETALRVLLGVVAFSFVAAALAVAAARITYPFPLEWMEGGMVLETGRVLRGHPLAPFTEGYRLDRSLARSSPPVPVVGIEIYPRYVFVPENETAETEHV